MTPSQASDPGKNCTAVAPSAVFLCAGGMETLTKRADFLRASSARRMGTGSFLLQARARDDGRAVIRVGYTASKKIGNAVARNRAKRRLRAAARALLGQHGQAGWDYVLVAKPQATIARNFSDLLGDLSRALAQIHRNPSPSAPPRGQA